MKSSHREHWVLVWWVMMLEAERWIACVSLAQLHCFGMFYAAMPNHFENYCERKCNLQLAKWLSWACTCAPSIHIPFGRLVVAEIFSNELQRCIQYSWLLQNTQLVCMCVFGASAAGGCRRARWNCCCQLISIKKFSQQQRIKPSQMASKWSSFVRLSWFIT